MSVFKRIVAIFICIFLFVQCITSFAQEIVKIEVIDSWLSKNTEKTLTVSLLLEVTTDTNVKAIAAICKDKELLQVSTKDTGRIISGITKRLDIDFGDLDSSIDESCVVKVFLWNDLMPAASMVVLDKDDIIAEKQQYELDFEENEFVLNEDYELGGGYNSKNVSVSSDKDHTTGSGKSLKLDNITSKSHRIKFMNVFDKTDLGKTFKITFWVYTPLDGDFSVKAGGYGISGTSYQTSAYSSGSPVMSLEKDTWKMYEMLYCHEGLEVTEIGIDQLGASEVASLIYIDDLKVEKQEPYLDEYSLRSVPTEKLTSKDLRDLYFYPYEKEERLDFSELGEAKVLKTDNDLYINNKKYASFETIDASDIGLDTARRTTVFGDPPLEYSVQYSVGKVSEDDFTSGDACLMKFYVRGIDSSNETGMCKLSAICENTDSMSTKCLNTVISFPADNKWYEIFIPFNIKYVKIFLRIGFYNQVFDIAGFELLNYKDTVSIDELPKSDYDEETIKELTDTNASWRNDALDRIEKIRKFDAKIIVKDKNGNLVENAFVKADMTEHEFGFGSAVSSIILRGGNSRCVEYRRQFSSLFNSAVSEDAHKYKVYKDNPERAKLMTDMLLNELGIRDYRGHVLTTDGIIEDESITLALPDASSDEETKKAYRDQVNALKRKQFSALIGDFKDELCEWDVLNEATARHKMYDVYGIDIYKEWYDIAREYAGPVLPLYYNEARISDENFYKLLDEMVEADIDFQGIGLETHYGFKQPSLFDNILKKVSTYGKTIKITEYDDTCTNPNLQANLLRDMLILAYSYESVDAFIMWGFNDSSHWLDNAPIFYEDWTLKPSGKMFIDLVYNKWWTNEEGYTDLNGQFSFSGFNGDYKISVTIDGKTKTVIKSISKNKNNEFEIVV